MELNPGRWLLISLVVIWMGCTAPPDTDLIGKDLGIEIPRHFELVHADHDPFGPGSDQDITYTFGFDSVNFGLLEKSIRKSALFNVADRSAFQGMDVGGKLGILRSLAVHRMSAYWIESSDIYWYSGDSLYLNTRDEVFGKLPGAKIVLPNMDSTGYRNTPVYAVTAWVDKKKRLLFYRYIHP